MGITDPAMATTAETPPCTTVDTDIPITVATDIPITVDTDTIVLRTGVGNASKRQERQGWPLDQAADARGRPECQLCGGYVHVFDLAWDPRPRRPVAASAQDQAQ